MTTGIVIDSFRKNNHEEVRALFSEFHGRQMAHVRIFETAESLEYPTTKGIAVQVTQLPQLKRLVDALYDEYVGRS